MKRRQARKIDFSTAYWSPPLTPQSVYDIEKDQINSAGLGAIVSITDHDSIDGTLQVNAKAEASRAPISLEWTVPFDYGFFHVGVHNLPKRPRGRDHQGSARRDFHRRKSLLTKSWRKRSRC
jgi:hypothetical protein